MPPSLPGRGHWAEGLRFQGVWGFLGEAVGWTRNQGGSLAFSQRNLQQEVPEGGQEIYFWGKESQVALAALRVGRALVGLQVVGDCSGTRTVAAPWRQAEGWILALLWVGRREL